MTESIDRAEGRRLFGLNPQGYDAARPRYPDALYRFLVAATGMTPNLSTLEIGGGTGMATRALIDLGANPLVVLEPDVRFRPSLEAVAATTRARVSIVETDFESFDASEQFFGLVAAATSFHWVRPAVGVGKVARLLRPGGHAALWWNVLQDVDKPDPFHVATQHVLRDLAVSPSGAPGTTPFALDRDARIADFDRTGAFERVQCFELRWTHVLDAHGVRQLYEGFAHIQRLDAAARVRVLDALVEIAETKFAGTVERNVTSILYVAQRVKQPAPTQPPTGPYRP